MSPDFLVNNSMDFTLISHICLNSLRLCLCSPNIKIFMKFVEAMFFDIKDSLNQHIITQVWGWGEERSDNQTNSQTIRQIVRQLDRQGVFNDGLAQCKIQHMLFYAHHTLVRSDRAPVQWRREKLAQWKIRDARHRLQKLKCVGNVGMSVSRHMHISGLVTQPVNFVIVNCKILQMSPRKNSKDGCLSCIQDQTILWGYKIYSETSNCICLNCQIYLQI